MFKTILSLLFVLTTCLQAIPLIPKSAPFTQEQKKGGTEKGEQNPNDITILNWNIEWFPGGKPNPTKKEVEDQINSVKEFIKDLNPDIIMAQEIRDWESFDTICAGVENMKPLAVSAFAREENYWPQQLAIGSRLKTMAAWSEPWKQGEKYLPRRGFTVAALRLPNTNYMLLVYTLHLKSNRVNEKSSPEHNQGTRKESVEQLIRHVEYAESKLFKGLIAGVIVGGDFNSNDYELSSDRVIKTMENAGFHNTWKDVARENRITWMGNSTHKPNCFDFIFTKNLGKSTTKLLLTPKEVSDHRALKLVIPHDVYKKRIDILNNQNIPQNINDNSEP